MRRASAADASLPTTTAAAFGPDVRVVHGDAAVAENVALVVLYDVPSERALLDRINVLIVPHANPDGAEAFVRDTAARIDMNRDHLLLRTPEAKREAWLDLQLAARTVGLSVPRATAKS